MTEFKYEMIVYWSEPDKAFLVEVPELPGCMADGGTREVAIKIPNGFGDAAAIDALREGLAREFGVRAAYSGADISKPEQIAAMVATTQRSRWRQ